MNRTDLNWFTTSRGEAPRLAWTHLLNNPPASLAYARESGQLAIADTRGGLFVIDRSGELVIHPAAQVRVGHVDLGEGRREGHGSRDGRKESFAPDRECHVE